MLASVIERDDYATKGQFLRASVEISPQRRMFCANLFPGRGRLVRARGAGGEVQCLPPRFARPRGAELQH
eukprot:5255838-Lingulodinium_polyedra.AAC.1